MVKDNEYHPYGPLGCPMECDCHGGECIASYPEKVREWAHNLMYPAEHMPKLAYEERRVIPIGWFEEHERRSKLVED